MQLSGMTACVGNTTCIACRLVAVKAVSHGEPACAGGTTPVSAAPHVAAPQVQPQDHIAKSVGQHSRSKTRSAGSWRSPQIATCLYSKMRDLCEVFTVSGAPDDPFLRKTQDCDLSVPLSGLKNIQLCARVCQFWCSLGLASSALMCLVRPDLAVQTLQDQSVQGDAAGIPLHTPSPRVGLVSSGAVPSSTHQAIRPSARCLEPLELLHTAYVSVCSTQRQYVKNEGSECSCSDGRKVLQMRGACCDPSPL